MERSVLVIRDNEIKLRLPGCEIRAVEDKIQDVRDAMVEGIKRDYDIGGGSE